MFDSVLVSTGGLRSITSLEAAKLLFDQEIFSLELSGGKYSSTFNKDLGKVMHCIKNLTLHNYCPAPKVPFVINLAFQIKLF